MVTTRLFDTISHLVSIDCVVSTEKYANISPLQLDLAGDSVYTCTTDHPRPSDRFAFQLGPPDQLLCYGRKRREERLVFFIARLDLRMYENSEISRNLCMLFYTIYSRTGLLVFYVRTRVNTINCTYIKAVEHTCIHKGLGRTTYD